MKDKEEEIREGKGRKEKRQEEIEREGNRGERKKESGDIWTIGRRCKKRAKKEIWNTE